MDTMTRLEFGSWIDEAARLFPLWKSLASSPMMDAVFRRLEPIPLATALSRLRAERARDLDAAAPELENVAIETRRQRPTENRNPTAIPERDRQAAERDGAAMRAWVAAKSDDQLSALQAEVVRGATGFKAALFRAANPRTSAMLIAAMRAHERDGVF